MASPPFGGGLNRSRLSPLANIALYRLPLYHNIRPFATLFTFYCRISQFMILMVFRRPVKGAAFLFFRVVTSCVDTKLSG